MGRFLESLAPRWRSEPCGVDISVVGCGGRQPLFEKVLSEGKERRKTTENDEEKECGAKSRVNTMFLGEQVC